ncbi:MAG: hypothetical protein P9L92_20210 [Candidatus Electryonea clarkiae]|nr:hypothetical protein [Candidatus Electryonea clarkiae]MDP8286599.1 hypothetical protein [Candidatus Electryonea clarkiae]
MSSFIILNEVDKGLVLVNTLNITYVSESGDNSAVHFIAQEEGAINRIVTEESLEEITNMIGTMKPQLF